MDITQQTFTAALIKLHSIQLKKAEGYTQDASSCFIKKYREMRRDTEIFLDYDESSTLEERVLQARVRSEQLRCEAADVDTVLPMMLKDKQGTYAVLMVLQHRFIHHRWEEYLEIYYSDERVKAALFEYVHVWLPQTRYTNTSSMVFHDPSPLAALLALVSAYTLHHQPQLASNYYSPAYAGLLMQLVHQSHPDAEIGLIQAVAYQAIRHAGRHYERELALALEECIKAPQHKRVLEILDKLLTQSLNLCADPKAATVLLQQAARFDVYHHRRVALTALLIAVALSILIIVSVGVMGHSLLVKTGVSAGAVGASALFIGYLWKQSEYRLPPVSIALKNLSTAVAPHL